MIRSQKGDMAVVFGYDFASKKSGIQFIVDGSDDFHGSHLLADVGQNAAVHIQDVAVGVNLVSVSQCYGSHFEFPLIVWSTDFL